MTKTTEISADEIQNILTKGVETAIEIRKAIYALEPRERRHKTQGIGQFSNQYEIDVLADNIVHDYLSDIDGFIVSEEREFSKEDIETNKLILVIDPVDGSTNAAHNLGYWCFSMAIMYQGQIVGAVVVDQVTHRIFKASEQDGATLGTPQGEVFPLYREELLAEKVGDLADNFSCAVICFASHEGSPIPFRHLRNFGASALSICDVAAGSIDAYIDDEDILLKPWDLLAAEYIAKLSGCTIKRRDSQGLMAATGVIVTKSNSLLKDFKNIFPNFFVN